MPETKVYYVRVGKYREYVHIETQGREGDELREFLAGVFLEDKPAGPERTAQVRCHDLGVDNEASPTTVHLGFELHANQFKLNHVNVGGFR